MNILPQHFEGPLDQKIATELFKRSVSNIEVSISSYCNRKCKYCPNSKFDRFTNKKNIRDELFISILSALQSIEYSGDFRIHRYNEPLADFNYAVKRISQVRSFLPMANIVVHTNGDFLDKRRLKTLEAMGVNKLVITLHAIDEVFDYKKMAILFEQRLFKLGFDFKIVADNFIGQTALIQVGENMIVKVRFMNFYALDEDKNLVMMDRAQSLNVNKQYSRYAPCFATHTELHVEYDGTLWPCCNFHSDVPDHRKHLIGELDEFKNLFVEWTNAAYVSWRKKLFTNELKESPCNTCDFGCERVSGELLARVDSLRDVFGLNNKVPNI